jgi:twinkle protein
MSYNIQNWDLIQTNKTSGISKMKCPVCHDGRKNKSDKSLTVWHNNGTAKCFNNGCDALFFKDSIESSIVKESYTLPSQEWRNYTKLSDKLVKYIEEERKIKQYTLNHFDITEESYYQPALNKEVNNIVFNYFESDTLVNKKYRSGNKKFTQSKNGKPIFYNINAIIGEEECYIVEGEFDVLALYEIGIKNAISIPNGANDNDNYWSNSEKYLKDVKKFYIATDNDESGNNVADKIAQRLGRYRCERITFEGKDANDDLKAGVLEKTIHNTSKYPVSGTFKVSDVIDNIFDLYDNGMPETIYPKHHSFGNLKDIFSVMRGHLITGTGIPSHGKSNFTEWYVLNLVRDYKMKVSFFSPEHHPFELHHTTFIEKVYGKNFFRDNDNCPRISKEEILRYKEWAEEKIYLTGTENGEFPTWDWLFEKFKEQMFNYGIDIFVIDAFNKLGFNGKGNRLEQINEVLTKLTMFAQMNNVIIFLVAHPTKMQKDLNGLYASPTLYDVSGSSDFRNQTHDGFCIYRYFGDGADEKGYTTFENLKTKMKFQGEIGGVVEFDYHIPSGRYYEKNTEVPTYCLIDEPKEFEEEKEVKEIKPIIPATPNEAFEITDPFNNKYNEDDEIMF